MTSKERILAALHGHEVDRIPFSPFLAYVWEYFPKDTQSMGQLAFHQHIGADPLWRGAPCPVKACPPAAMECRTQETGGRTITEIHTPVGVLRQAWVRSEIGNTNFLVEHPLKSEQDYRVQLWIEENTTLTEDLSPVHAHLAGDGREGLSLGMLIPRGKSAFQSMVEHLAGTEELAYALADFPATVTELWRVMVAKDRGGWRPVCLSQFGFMSAGRYHCQV